MLIRRYPKPATAGKSSSPSGCVGTTAMTRSTHASYASTTSTVRWHLWRSREGAGSHLSQGRQAVLDDGDEIEIWGDGKQTRSFMYIDDCVDGIERVLHGDSARPVNLAVQRTGDHQSNGRYHREASPGSSSSVGISSDAPKGVERPQQR